MSNHHHHDDGLTHGHAWARNERPPHERARAAQHGTRATPDAPRHRHAPAPDHDDGLVHDHAWARTERLSAYAAE
jgi:hypothetical protein